MLTKAEPNRNKGENEDFSFKKENSISWQLFNGSGFTELINEVSIQRMHFVFTQAILI